MLRSAGNFSAAIFEEGTRLWDTSGFLKRYIILRRVNGFDDILFNTLMTGAVILSWKSLARLKETFPERDANYGGDTRTLVSTECRDAT